MESTRPRSLTVALSDRLVERFWSKVDMCGIDECWPWKAGRLHFGHGAFSGRETGQRSPIGAHRMAWKIAHDSTRGLCVLHKCDNPPCCNPRHLFLGTKAENTADRHRKGRDARGLRSGRYTMPERTARGERNGRAVLSSRDIPRIVAARKRGDTLASIGARFGVGTSQVNRIASGKAWRTNGN